MGNFTTRIIQNPLVSNLNEYELNPNAWIEEQLVNGTCDISSSTIILTPEASHSTLYSLGVGYFRPQLFYRARSVREEHNIYYIPFSSEVWICLFGLLLAITVALTFILARETKLPHDTPYDIIARIADEQHDEGMEWNEINEIPSRESLLQRERWEMGEILLVAIGALGQQGSARDPSTSAARMLLLVMLLLAALAYTAYSASVISFVSLLPSAEKEQSVLTKNVPTDRKISIHDTNFFKYSFQVSISFKN
ncbi:UNVERIFIED_CONTAM: hypothetical protein PYX00_000155 [Menopon gallinae]|uniref:Ionotropic glutamate receptor C-terminal domain-containing protein n=1 Tax=Menopon gallinae TaxID=328185 RepID=A0AAW2I9E0_9NEOP